MAATLPPHYAVTAGRSTERIAAVADPVITVDAVAAAEALLGIACTDAERAMMLDGLAAQLALIRARRAVPLPEGLAPATRFDPRLPGWRAPPPLPFRPSAAPSPPLPDDAADIAFAPVATLAGWLRGGAISSVALTQIYLDRIARLDPVLHVRALATPALALEQAARADRLLAAGTWLGPLHGIPWGCKDIIDTAGIETAWGAEPYRGRVPARDATVVTRLAAAGAVLLGKLSVGALAFGDLWYGGRTRTPWNPALGSGGSSAGSAAAVAAGLVGFALGTETLGSIVVPAERCGAVGLRPTFGRVPRSGTMPLCWSLDKIGPLARGVEDTALILHALLAPDPADPCQIVAPFGYDAAAPLDGMRLGHFPDDWPDGQGPPLAALAALGITPVPLARADLPYEALRPILTAEAAASFEQLTLSDRDDLLAWQEPRAWPNTFRRARFLSAIDHIQADRLRRRVMQAMAAVFDQVDAIIGPPLAGPMLLISNFTGHPCLVLPSGLRDGMPQALCLWGRLFEEGTILRLGRALEPLLRFPGRPPEPAATGGR